MKRILIVNGPNLNMLGIREPDIYGEKTYKDLCGMIEEYAKERKIKVDFVQSNHEGDLVEFRTVEREDALLNPAAYTHTSVALLDALKAVGIPAVEVHISDVDEREAFRRISYVRNACVACIKGHGFEGYTEAIDLLIANGGTSL